MGKREVRRLRISEQLLIVLFLAVLLPLCIAAVIVINVNQHAVRGELRYSANITTDNVYQRLLNSIEEKKLSALYLAKSVNYIKSTSKIRKFLAEITHSSDEIKRIELIDNSINLKSSNYIPDFADSNIEIFHDIDKNTLIIYAKLNDGRYIRELIDLTKLESVVFKYLINDKRQVYIVDSNNSIVMAYNRDEIIFQDVIKSLPVEYNPGEPVLFGKQKNQPNIFLKLTEPDWAIIVVTPKKLTSYGIVNARYKIIISLIVAALVIIIIGLWYSYSLNTNIKQLLKAISAIASGNYRKRVRLIRDFFTPFEVVFLANEFNNMAQRVDDSYKKLQHANKKLAKLDKMKSNLIDTVSHEFRTPLTCIKGYTSRLLRSDINVDQETKIKSLKVIKQQTERLGRLVEDLLVIPDLESSLLRFFPDEINLREIFEDCILSIQQKQHRLINLSIEEDISTIYADQDRTEQVIINLLDNAVKYSVENTEININISKSDNRAVISIQNECPKIPDDMLKSLFDKFTRLDDNLTRTTRGTGLGLFIAKGLVEAMGGKISLSSKSGFEVIFTLPLIAENSQNLEDPTLMPVENE